MSENVPSSEVMAEFALYRAELEARRSMRPAIEEEGVAALGRLLPIAQSDTGQSRRVATFLLGLYNGDRFKFDLTDLRGLDYALHDDCLAVLRMDHSPTKEVHRYFDRGGDIFERLAATWKME
jgi:hypothetical protein